MANIYWIKLATNMFDDEKIRLIESSRGGDQMIVIWIKLLCLAGKTNNRGSLMITETLPYTIESLSRIIGNRSEVVLKSMRTFIEMEMVYEENGIYFISNWEKHQNSEKLEIRREYYREAKKKQREKTKKVFDKSLTKVGSPQTELELELDIEKDNNKRDIEKSKKAHTQSLKSVYGEFKNVKLKADEYETLSKDGHLVYIDRLSSYKASKGKEYKDDYATIRNWMNKDAKEQAEKQIDIKQTKGNTGDYGDLRSL